MKQIFLLVVVILLTASANLTAQEVVAANGGSATIASSQVSWTIGELVIETVGTSPNILTQGFHQTLLIITAINELEALGIEIKVYPNPTQDFVNIRFNELTDSPAYLLFDLTGKLIKRDKITSTNVKLNMTNYAGGTYILKLTNGKQPLQSFKIVKR